MPKVTMDISGLDALERKIYLLAHEANTVAARALYKGAGKAADGLRAATESLIAVNDYHKMISQRKKRPDYLSVNQKAGLLEGLGIAPFKFTEDEVYTTVGFGGMNGLRTRKWPNGQPNKMIAGVVNHGDSSHTIRQPFITTTAEVYASDIRIAMILAATEEMDKILGD